jgi:tetratricopeptide (TPR) repeat protein
MRKTIWLTGVLLLLAALPLPAQIGKIVPIKAGTPEDHAVTEINSATDPAQQLALIDKFAADFGTGDMAIVANDLYVNYYIAAKNYPKAFEYGAKLWALDPDNFSNGVNMLRAAAAVGDEAKLFDYGDKIGAIVQRFKAQPAPEGTTAQDWAQQKEMALDGIHDNLDWVGHTIFLAGYGKKDPAARAAALLRFVAAFPSSSLAAQAQEIAANSYRQAQQTAKMLDVANKLLEKDPDNRAMLLLLADYYSEKGEQLDKAATNAARVVELTGKAVKPEGMTDEQWTPQIQLEKGLALSALGQINIQKKDNAKAVENLQAAAPLLKSNPDMYARNQYRLGFALLNLRKTAEGKAALEEVAATVNPYQALAQQKLKSLGSAPRRAPAKKR